MSATAQASPVRAHTVGVLCDFTPCVILAVVLFTPFGVLSLPQRGSTVYAFILVVGHIVGFRGIPALCMAFLPFHVIEARAIDFAVLFDYGQYIAFELKQPFAEPLQVVRYISLCYAHSFGDFGVIETAHIQLVECQHFRVLLQQLAHFGYVYFGVVGRVRFGFESR